MRLLTCATSPTGYAYVRQLSRRFQALVPGQINLGWFDTAVEAAVAVARHLSPLSEKEKRSAATRDGDAGGSDAADGLPATVRRLRRPAARGVGAEGSRVITGCSGHHRCRKEGDGGRGAAAQGKNGACTR